MTTPQKQLDSFIARFTPEMAALGRKMFAHMKRRLPGSVMTVYDNYNALVVGFGPEGRVSTTPLSVALYPRWANLFFLTGARLQDPKRLLKGSGAIVRSIRVEDAELLNDEDVDALITAAVLDVGWRLDPKATCRLVIQSISAKQRPRRP